MKNKLINIFIITIIIVILFLSFKLGYEFYFIKNTFNKTKIVNLSSEIIKFNFKIRISINDEVIELNE